MRFLLLLPFLVVAVAAQELASGGIILATGRQFFETNKVMFLNTFMEALQNATFKSNTYLIPVPKMMIINATTQRFKLVNASFDPGSVVFEIHRAKPQLNCSLRNVSFTFEFEYNVTSDPELIQEIGKSQIVVRNLDITGSGSPLVEFSNAAQANEYKIEISAIKMQVESINASLHGGDVAGIINMFSDTLTELWRNFLMRSFDDAMRVSLNDIINHQLMSDKVKTSRQFLFKGRELEFDYRLTDDGVHITDNSLSVIFDGTCHPANEDHKHIKRNYNNMPVFDPQGNQLQIFIGEYAMTSFLETVVDLHYLKYNTSMSSDQIESIIEDFETPFGDQPKVMIKFLTTNSTNFKPQVAIDTAETYFKFQVEIHIMNPFDDEVDAVVLMTEIKPFISFSLGEDFKLYLETEELDIAFTHADAFFKSSLTKQNLNDRIAFVKPFAVAYINSQFVDGIGIPIPENYKAMIVNPHIKSYKDYIKIDFEPSLRGKGLKAPVKRRAAVRPRVQATNT